MESMLHDSFKSCEQHVKFSFAQVRFFSGVLPGSGGTDDDMFSDRYVTVRVGWYLAWKRVRKVTTATEVKSKSENQQRKVNYRNENG